MLAYHLAQHNITKDIVVTCVPAAGCDFLDPA